MCVKHTDQKKSLGGMGRRAKHRRAAGQAAATDGTEDFVAERSIDLSGLDWVRDQDKVGALVNEFCLAIAAAGEGPLVDAALAVTSGMRNRTLTVDDVNDLAMALEGRRLPAFEAVKVQAVIRLLKVAPEVFSMVQACKGAGQRQGGTQGPVKISRGQQAQEQQQGDSSAMAQAHQEKVGQQHGGSCTMAHALGQRTEVQTLMGALARDLQDKARLPKPRSASSMNEELWQGARRSAMAEVIQQYGIAGELDEYYVSMCRVGQQLLADRIQDKTQSIYDYRVSKSNTRNKQSVSAA